MSHIIQKLKTTLVSTFSNKFFIALSLLSLLQIIIIFKESLSAKGFITFITETPMQISLQDEPTPAEAISLSSKTSINLSQLSELESLPEIGKISAQKIIDSRPYNNISELVSKNTISESTLNKIKDLITL